MLPDQLDKTELEASSDKAATIGAVTRSAGKPIKCRGTQGPVRSLLPLNWALVL